MLPDFVLPVLMYTARKRRLKRLQRKLVRTQQDVQNDATHS